jgi:sodium transport system permease protein
MSAIPLIYKKELREFLRDRRVLMSSVLMPMFLVYILFTFLGSFTKFLSQESKESEIAVVNIDNGQPLLDSPFVKKGFKIRSVPSVDMGVTMVREKTVKLCVNFKSDLKKALATGDGGAIDVLIDKKSIPAAIALGVFKEAVKQLNAAHGKQVLASKNLTEKDITPLSVNEVAATEAKEEGPAMLASLLPYFMVLFAFFGGMTMAGDVVAGEKERGTLETLLVSPASRLDIAIGKLLSMATLCFTSSLSGVIGVVLVGITGVTQKGEMFKGAQHLGPGEIGVMLVTLIPLVAMFAAMLVAISAFAKNQREATTYASAISVLVMVPAIASQFIGFTDFGSRAWIGLVPILNTATVFQQVFNGQLNGTVFALTLTTSTVLAALCLWFAVRMFQRESVLFRV